MRFRSGYFAVAVFAVALLGAAPSAAAAPRIPGVDVSRFDGAIAWPTVSASGIRFAFVEASRGSGADCTVKPLECGADPVYATNYAGARAAGIRVGPYHRGFAGGTTRALARADAAAEASLFVTQVGSLAPGDLLPVLDVETPFTGLNAGRLRVWIRTWLKRVRAGLSVKPIIYTNASSWSATGNTTEFSPGHPLWVAEWGVSRPSVPAGSWGGRGWSVWQFTNNGRVPGIPGLPDRDVAVGLGKISVR